MIFNINELCSCSDCSEYTGNDIIKKDNTELGILLVSSKGAFADEVIGTMSAGSLLLFKGNIKITPFDGAHCIVCLLHGETVKYAAKQMPNRVVSDCSSCPMAAEIMSCLLEAPTSSSRTAQLSFELLCEISRANEQKKPLSALISEAINEIHKGYAGIYGVEELSTQLGVSKSHLVRVFSKSMGITPGQYLTRVRIDAAKQLLLTRKYSLELIATLCGFSGANYFCKVFRGQTGQTPAEYRKAASLEGQSILNLSDIESSLFV